MLLLAELHLRSGRLALLRNNGYAKRWLELRTLDGLVLGDIPNEFLPISSHWSPDGSTVAFGTNDGQLYLYRLGETAPTVAFSNPPLNAGFCEWSADGNRLVFSAYDGARPIPPDIYCLALDTGQITKLTNDPRRADRFPHWSPSGQWVAFHRQDMDGPDMPMRINVLDMQSGQCFPVLKTPGGTCRTGRHGWSADSSALLVMHTDSDSVHLMAIRLHDQAIAWRYVSKTLQGGAFSPDGDRILCLCSDELLWFAYPEGQLIQRLSLTTMAPVRVVFGSPQVGFDRDPSVIYFLGTNSCWYRWKIGAECECLLADSPPPKPAFTQEAYVVTARDGRSIPVQRFIPPNPKSPAILYVQGGPGLAIDPDDPFMLRLLAEGIEFVCVAYRGSSGYGLEHQDANRGEYGRGDVWDIMAAGRDWKTRSGSNRPLIVTGYSYGGFLALLAMAHAGVPWAGGIVLWGLSGLQHLPAHQHRAWPVDPEQQAAARLERSPLEQARYIRGPLLIFHGALDTVATTEEMQSIQNSVLAGGGDCELVVYEDDTHGLQRHRDDILTRIQDFLERFDNPQKLAV